MSDKPLVVLNAEKDESYAPYCLRCSTMRRMRKIAPMYWTCAAHCGAIADYREFLVTPTGGPQDVK